MSIEMNEPAEDVKRIRPTFNGAQIEIQSMTALHMMADGSSVREIAAALGVSVGTAHARLKAGIKAYREQAIEELADKQARRTLQLDHTLAKVAKLLNDDDVDALKVLAEMRQTIIAAAKVEGSVAPKTIKIGRDEEEPDDDPRLAELLDAAQAERERRAEQKREASRERSRLRGFDHHPAGRPADVDQHPDRGEAASASRPARDDVAGGVASWWETLSDEAWNALPPEEQHRARDEWNARRAYGRELER